MSKLKKKLKTQGKNSKLKTKTQFFGIFRILRCEKGVQKKPGLGPKISKNAYKQILVYILLVMSLIINSVLTRVLTT